ncbi:MAG: helix-turn-helix domain-containing protein [Deltaproteobacteria bacterium]|nr:helix-turn-helix domain-containing protein [Deltaproteobacteria bacterium]
MDNEFILPDNICMRANAVLPKKLGKRIQKRRKEVGLTQEDLADKIGVSRAYMGFIEQGRNMPSVEVLEKIARQLKIRMSELF